MLEEMRYICGLRPDHLSPEVPVLLPVDTRQSSSSSPEGLGVLATAIYSADEAFSGEWRGCQLLC